MDQHPVDQTPDDENFAAMLERSLLEATPLKPGERVEAAVLQVGAEWVFLDVGQKGEGVLDVKELLDADGQATVAPGDRLNVYFLGRSADELRFTTRIGGRAGAGTAHLEEAWRNGIPVEIDIIQGGVAKRIIKTADEMGADLIVLGDTGRTGLKRLGMGSIAETVMRASSIPVMVVKAD